MNSTSVLLEKPDLDDLEPDEVAFEFIDHCVCHFEDGSPSVHCPPGSFAIVKRWATEKIDAFDAAPDVMRLSA